MTQLARLVTGLVGKNLQVTPRSIGAPAQVMLKVLARRARALRHDVKGQGFGGCGAMLQTQKTHFSRLERQRHRVALKVSGHPGRGISRERRDIDLWEWETVGIVGVAR